MLNLNLDLESLTDFTSLFEDPRRGQGQRHKLHDIIVIMLMAIISNNQSIKGFARFAKSNEEDLTLRLNLKHGVPSFNTFRHILDNISEQIFADNFMIYMKKHYKDWHDEFISMDGKAIKSSVSDARTKSQNFISIVSAFGQTSHMVYSMKSFENNKSVETNVVQDLIKDMELENKTFTLDALHCKKNAISDCGD
jgi:hypothetical protein